MEDLSHTFLPTFKGLLCGFLNTEFDADHNRKMEEWHPPSVLTVLEGNGEKNHN